MSDHKGDPLDEVISGFRQMPVPALPDPSDLLSRLTPALDGGGRSPSAVLPLLWSFLMRPTVRYLSATGLLLGALTWLALGPSGAVALAEVIQATGQHKLVRYQLRETFTYKTDEVTDQTRTVYADLVAPRLRFEQRQRALSGVLEAESVMVQDNQKDRFLKLSAHVQVVDESHADAEQKRAIQLVKERGLPMKRAFLYRLRGEDGQPLYLDDLIKGQPLLESLRELRDHKGTTSARARLDGREMLKYRLQERGTTTTLWVDPRTKLPVQIECVIDHPARDQDISKIVAIYSRFEWDPSGADPERLFSTEPPAGYAVEDHTNAPGAGSTTARVEPTGSPNAPGAGSTTARVEPTGSPESAAVLKRLDEKVAMQFPNAIPLEQVLEYIRVATRGPSGAGIPWAFDEEGMKRAGQSRTSVVKIDVQGEPLKTSLKRLLEPLGLTYEVRRGVVTITSEAAGSRKRP